MSLVLSPGGKVEIKNHPPVKKIILPDEPLVDKDRLPVPPGKETTFRYEDI